MKFARVVDEVAVEVTDEDPAGRFHPLLAEQFEAVPDVVEAGWVRSGGEWQAGEALEEPSEPYVPVQLAIIDLLRRFTHTELTLYLAKEAQARALTPADYAAAAGGDAELQLLVGFRLFLTFFDSLRTGVIEINHPQTVDGLSLLVPLGVISPERLPEILSTL